MVKFLALVLAVTGVPAVGSSQPQAQQPAAKPVKEKKICKTLGEEEIGSRFGKDRVCKTAAEWDKLEKALHRR